MKRRRIIAVVGLWLMGAGAALGQTALPGLQATAKIDGEPYYTQEIDPETMDEFHGEFFLILNVAVGGNLGGDVPPETSWPQKMYVDWVRVYGEEPQ